MADETRNRRRDTLWALPASLILHGLLIAVLVAYSQPRAAQQPEEEAVNVTLAPPPEQPKPEPAPPPPPKPPEEKKPEEPKQPPAAEPEQTKPAKIEVLKPVFQFGDKDAGSGKSAEQGGGVQTPSPTTDDGAKPHAEKQPDAEKQTEAAKDAQPTQDAENGAATPQDATKEAQPAQDTPNEAAAPQDAGQQAKDKQDGLAEGADQQTAAAPPPLGADGSDGELALPALAKAPEPRPAAAPKPSRSEFTKPRGASRAKNQDNADAAAAQPFSGLPGVRRPQSQGGDALSTTAMAGVPRDKRAARLCASALQQQLLQASYSPDLVPLVPLKRGNVLDVPEAAFRTRTAWHELSYRCEVDADATTIRSLTFRVGGTIPRDQWGRLGLPAGN